MSFLNTCEIYNVSWDTNRTCMGKNSNDPDFILIHVRVRKYVGYFLGNDGCVLKRYGGFFGNEARREGGGGGSQSLSNLLDIFIKFTVYLKHCRTQAPYLLLAVLKQH